MTSEQLALVGVMDNVATMNKKNLAVLIHLGRLDSADVLSHYTLALAMIRLSRCCLVTAQDSPDINNLSITDSRIVCLTGQQSACDWRADIVITCGEGPFSRQLGHNLKTQQGSVWIERHDGLQTHSDAQWTSEFLPQPRYQTWCSNDTTRDFFVQKLGEVLNGLPEPTDPADVKPAEPADNHQRDVVLFWKQNDSLLYGRRSDMVAKTLAERPEVRRVLVVDAPLSEAKFASWLTAERTSQHGLVYQRLAARLFRQCDNGNLAYRTYLFNADNPEQDNATAYLAFLQHQFDALGIEPGQAVFWLYPKLLKWGEALVPHFKPAQVVVDIVDDHRRWPGVDEARRKKLTEHYRKILSQADQVITNCGPVKADFEEFGRSIEVYPNACEFPPSIATPAGDEHYQRLVAHTGPVLGYVGNLESKLDIALLQQLADRIPQALVVLIGSTHASEDLSALTERPNIMVTGVKPHAQAGAFIRHFSVGLLPHKRTSLTEVMNPLKVYVYLSHCVPVVSTDVNNIVKFDYVWQASDTETFITTVKSVLAQRAAELLETDKFIRFVKENSWQQRLKPLLDMLLKRD